MLRLVPLFAMIVLAFAACNLSGASNAQSHVSVISPPVPTSYPDQPACRVKSIQKLPPKFEVMTKSPASNRWVATKFVDNGVSQVYTKPGSNDFTCITCTEHP